MCPTRDVSGVVKSEINSKHLFSGMFAQLRRQPIESRFSNMNICRISLCQLTIFKCGVVWHFEACSFELDLCKSFWHFSSEEKILCREGNFFALMETLFRERLMVFPSVSLR